MAKDQAKKAKTTQAKQAKNIRELSSKTREAIRNYYQMVWQEHRLKLQKAEVDELALRVPKKELPEYKKATDNIRKAVKHKTTAMLKQSSKS